MPIYEYVCNECDAHFSLLQSLYPADRSTICPKCASKDVQKTISSFSCGKSDAPSPSAPQFGGGGGG